MTNSLQVRVARLEDGMYFAMSPSLPEEIGAWGYGPDEDAAIRDLIECLDEWGDLPTGFASNVECR